MTDQIVISIQAIMAYEGACNRLKVTSLEEYSWQFFSGEVTHIGAVLTQSIVNVCRA